MLVLDLELAYEHYKKLAFFVTLEKTSLCIFFNGIYINIDVV